MAAANQSGGMAAALQMYTITRMKWAALLLFATVLHAQAPHEEWCTIETKHFRVHYPAGYQAWSERAAWRLESIREHVVREIGYAPPQTIDVVIQNPIASPNGFAWPLIDGPRLVFYADPPGPESQIGDYSNWIDLLAVHEIAHLVHLLRPSRNPLQRELHRLFPLGPIPLAAPRWVSEGYATVIEGRMTGAGRPSSAIRAAILRKWAATGRLPSYAELNSSRRFLGMSMAYLAGSAFLEWLEVRGGAGSLQKLWARMTARQRRSFAQAFEGVFGDRPDRLYGMFVAELTARATREGAPAEGELWQETGWESGEPDVSPDGNEIAVVIRRRERPARLVVWSTGEPEEERKKQEEAIAKMLRLDPEDVPPKRLAPIPRKERHALVMPDGGDIESPRWMPDGKAILFVHRQPDRDGVLHRDLFRWTPSSGSVERLTHLADVKDADPFPDGVRAVAVRNRKGFSQLVIVDLAASAITPLSEPSLDFVYSHPRVHADGKRIVYAAHGAGTWKLFVRDLESQTMTQLAIPEGSNAASPEWSGDDVVAAILTRGSIDIHRVTTRERLTATLGGAFDPAPAPDGSLFFMSLEPDGYVVRVLGGAPAVSPALLSRGAGEAAGAPRRFDEEKVSSRPYGTGRMEVAWLPGGVSSPAFNATEIGVRAGDIIGRLDIVGIASLGGSEFRGGSVAAAWRGWPVEVSAHLFRTENDDGLEARASWTAEFPLQSIAVDAGALAGSRDLAFADARWRARLVRDATRFEGDARVAGEIGDGMRHGRLTLGGFVRRGAIRIGGRFQYDASSDGGLSLGGILPSVLPRSAMATRVLDPALPFGRLQGERYRGMRIEASRGAVTAFFQEHRMNGRIRVAGAEVRVASGPVPLLRLPALDLLLGVARVAERHRDSDVVTWSALRWRP